MDKPENTFIIIIIIIIVIVIIIIIIIKLLIFFKIQVKLFIRKGKERPHLFSFNYAQGVLYTRWRPPQ